MSGSTSTPTAPSGTMRDRILQSALDVLRDDGAAALTVRRVAELAGCSTTGIYTHFGGKSGLIESIFVGGFESFDEALFPHYQRGDLLDAGRWYRRWALSNPMHYLVMFGRAVPDYEPSTEALEHATRSFAALRAALAGAGSADPDHASLHVYATVHGYVMLELAGLVPPDVDVDRLYDDGLRATLGVVLGRT